MERVVAELRAEVRGDTLQGYASVFDTTALVNGVYETVARTAFDEALKTSDAAFTLNHEPSQLLGRQSSGTLSLFTDERGLGFEVKLPNTTLGNDVRELVARGDLNGASFAFIPNKVSRGVAPDGKRVVTHTSVRALLDASVVTRPAYEGTVVALRHADINYEADGLDNRTRLIRVRQTLRRV
jgi:Escherichia/Staphylococcus phage prohead protease